MFRLRKSHREGCASIVGVTGRRPLGAVAVLVVIVVAGAAWWTSFRGPSSEDCAPVQEMLTFNKTQIDAMNAKTSVPEEGSGAQASEPSDLDYLNWADGLADRAAKVSAPELADQAKEVAQTAGRLVRARIDVNAQREVTAPGAGAPPAAMVVTALNGQFEGEVSRLAKACA